MSSRRLLDYEAPAAEPFAAADPTLFGFVVASFVP